MVQKILSIFTKDDINNLINSFIEDFFLFFGLDKIKIKEKINERSREFKREVNNVFFYPKTFPLCKIFAYCYYTSNNNIEVVINLSTFKEVAKIIIDINELRYFYYHILLHELYHIFYLHVFSKYPLGPIHEKTFEEDKDYEEIEKVLEELGSKKIENINKLKKYKNLYRETIEKIRNTERKLLIDNELEITELLLIQ